MRVNKNLKGHYRELIIGMIRPGIFGFGGGPSVVPLIRYEAVQRYKWVTEEEFGEVLGIANALPGPIATKMAAYLGYKVRGTMGAVVSVAAHIFPTSLAIIFLLHLMKAGTDYPAVSRMIEAIIPVIAVLIGQMTWEFGEKTWKGLGKYLGIFLMAAAFFALHFVHPAIVIAAFLLYGSFHFKWKRANSNKKETLP